MTHTMQVGINRHGHHVHFHSVVTASDDSDGVCPRLPCATMSLGRGATQTHASVASQPARPSRATPNSCVRLQTTARAPVAALSLVAASDAYPRKCGVSAGKAITCTTNQLCMASGDNDGVSQAPAWSNFAGAVSDAYPCKCGVSTGMAVTRTTDQLRTALDDLGLPGEGMYYPPTSLPGAMGATMSLVRRATHTHPRVASQLTRPSTAPPISCTRFGYSDGVYQTLGCSNVAGAASIAYPGKCGVTAGTAITCTTDQLRTASDNSGVCHQCRCVPSCSRSQSSLRCLLAFQGE